MSGSSTRTKVARRAKPSKATSSPKCASGFCSKGNRLVDEVTCQVGQLARAGPARCGEKLIETLAIRECSFDAGRLCQRPNGADVVEQPQIHPQVAQQCRRVPGNARGHEHGPHQFGRISSELEEETLHGGSFVERHVQPPGFRHFERIDRCGRTCLTDGKFAAVVFR